jgi:hypothetical protein
MNCENRSGKMHYYLSCNLAEFDECGKGQKDPEGRVHSGQEHLLWARSTKEQCHPKADASNGMMLSEFLG